MVIKKELALVSFLTASGFMIGTVPWIFLLSEKTKGYVYWMGKIGFQYWGWFLVFCLAGYAFIKILKLKTAPKTARTILGIVSLIILGWSLLWAFIIVCGLALSKIV